jgi:hypothetical protein
MTSGLGRLGRQCSSMKQLEVDDLGSVQVGTHPDVPIVLDRY